jgi:hypothetical protein
MKKRPLLHSKKVEVCRAIFDKEPVTVLGKTLFAILLGVRLYSTIFFAEARWLDRIRLA